MHHHCKPTNEPKGAAKNSSVQKTHDIAGPINSWPTLGGSFLGSAEFDRLFLAGFWPTTFLVAHRTGGTPTPVRLPHILLGAFVWPDFFPIPSLVGQRGKACHLLSLILRLRNACGWRRRLEGRIRGNSIFRRWIRVKTVRLSSKKQPVNEGCRTLLL
jgi:hypothetical protein